MHERVPHLLGKVRLIDKGIYFEVVFETTEVHIGGSDAGDGVVAYDLLSSSARL